MLFKKILLLIFLSFLLTLSSESFARNIINGKDLSATVYDTLRCGQDVILFVNAPSKSYFEGDKVQLQKLVGGARMVLELDCPSISKISVHGKVNKRVVYTGKLTRENNWILIDIPSQYEQGNSPKYTEPAPQGISYDKRGYMVLYQAPGVVVYGPIRKLLDNWCEDSNNKNFDDYRTISARLMGDFKNKELDPEQVFAPSIEEFLAKNVLPKMIKACPEPPHMVDFHVEHIAYNYNSISKDNFFFVVRDGKLLKLNYGSPTDGEGSFRKTKASPERLSYYQSMQMTPQDREKIRGPILYKDHNIEIYTHKFRVSDPIWPKRRELDLVFDVDPFESEALLKLDYIAPIVFDIARKYDPSFNCKDGIHVYQYHRDEAYYWAEVEYKSYKNTCTKAGDFDERLVGRSRDAREVMDNRTDKYWGGCDAKEPFCDLPGGKYLNAIYRGDWETVENIDSKSASSFSNGSMLKFVTNKYLYDFPNYCRDQLRADVVSKTFSYTTDKIQYETLSGIPAGTVGGDTYSATYVVNPEFAQLMRRVGSHNGSRVEEFGAGYMFHGLAAVMDGVEKIQEKTGCKGDDVKAFEKHLIDFTTRVLDASD